MRSGGVASILAPIAGVVVVCLLWFSPWNQGPSDDVGSHFEIDLGILETGRQFRFPLTIPNADGESWRTDSISTTCGCVKVDHVRAASNGSLEMDLIVNTVSRLGVSQNAIMIPHERGGRRTSVLVRTTIVGGASVNPPVLVIRSGSTGAAHSAVGEVVVWGDVDDNCSVELMEAPDGVVVTIDEPRADSGGVKRSARFRVSDGRVEQRSDFEVRLCVKVGERCEVVAAQVTRLEPAGPTVRPAALFVREDVREIEACLRLNSTDKEDRVLSLAVDGGGDVLAWNAVGDRLNVRVRLDPGSLGDMKIELPDSVLHVPLARVVGE